MNKDPIISVYKKFIYVVIFFITAISILISMLTLKPFYDNLMIEDKTKYYLYGDTLKTQIEDKITQYKQIANQIATRTRAKSTLIEYNNNNNTINLENANQILLNILGDALKDSSIQGIQRVNPEGKVLAQIGIIHDAFNLENEHVSDVNYFIHKESGALYLSITTPIYDNKKLIGSDRVTFTVSEIENIINKNKIFSTTKIQLLDSKNNALLSNNFNSPHSGKSIENRYSLVDAAYILKCSVEESELHQSTYKKIKEIIYTILILLLVSLVGIYFISKRLLGLVEIKIAQKKELQAMKTQTAKFATIGYILFAIEHEWRKPLNYLSALSAKFQHKMHQNAHMDEKAFHDFLIVVDETVHDMSQTMTDFKQIYLPSYQKEEIQMEYLINQTVEYFKKNKNIKKIKIDYNMQQDKIHTYAYAWRYIVLNLLQNSYEKFSQTKRDLLHIRMSFDGKIFTFEDNAGGAEDISKILQLFYTTKKYDKSGIGLFIVKSLVEDSLAGKIYFSHIENGLKVSIAIEESVK
ncbi:MAG: ATP-binding protein [Sulfurimonas sp.]|nr:ATP-binding protein [Sulfurimonas sp.]